MTEAPKKKVGVWVWIIGGCLGLVVLGMGTCAVVGYVFVKKAMIMDPAKVEEVARGILPLQKPEGMQGVMAMDIMGTQVAVLGEKGPNQGGQVIMLFSIPAEQKGQFNSGQIVNQHGGGGEVVETKPGQAFKLRGKDVTATLQVVKSQDGGRMSQYSFNLPEGGKVIMAIFMGPEAVLTKERVQAILDTVK
jgi:hypothetical protein